MRRLDMRERREDKIFNLAALFMRYCMFIGIAYFVFRMVEVAAGKNTVVIVNALLSMGADQWVAYIFGAGGIAFGARAHQLRKRTIERLGPYAAKLEGKIADGRPSSGLLPDGSTPPPQLEAVPLESVQVEAE